MRGKVLGVRIKEEIAQAYLSGQGTQAEIAKKYGVSEASVYNCVKQFGSAAMNNAEPKDPTAPPRDAMAGFTPLYQRIVELNGEKKRINEELANIKATLQNALEIAESGEIPK